MVIKAPRISRSPGCPVALENKRFCLPVSQRLSPIPTSTEAFDQDLFTELYFRDYIRGKFLIGKWREAVLELSDTHNIGRFQVDRASRLVPVPGSATVAGVRLVHNANEDHIGFVVQLFDKPAVYFETDVPSIEIFRLHTELHFLRDTDAAPFDADHATRLWNLTLGARIVEGWMEEGEMKLPSMLHAYLAEHGVTAIRFIPHGMMYGLPLTAAARLEGNTLRYAIEDYDITYCLPWKPNPQNRDDDAAAPTAVGTPRELFAADVSRERSQLAYSHAEIDALARDSVEPSFWGYRSSAPSDECAFPGSLLSKLERAGSAHFMCHGLLKPGQEDTNCLVLGDETGVHHLRSSDLLNFKFASAPSIFLNSCNSSGAASGTLDESYTLPVYFLAAGARTVVATTHRIADGEAFRIALRVRELQQRGYDVGKAVRQTCLECVQGTLPFFTATLAALGHTEPADESEYLESRGTLRTVGSWTSYIFWTNG
jgi:hypothetical protein